MWKRNLLRVSPLMEERFVQLARVNMWKGNAKIFKLTAKSRFLNENLTFSFNITLSGPKKDPLQ